MATVYLVDDDAGVRTALSRLFRIEGFQTASFDSAEAFLQQQEFQSPACVVLDVSMPGLDGLALQRVLRERSRDLPIVFLTGCGDIPMSVGAMKAGAVDFLTKPVHADQLLAAVRSGIERQDEGERDSELRERYRRLTAREREVLALLVAGKLNKQVAAELGLALQTVKFHRGRIMARMQAATIAELMYMLARIGH